MKATKGLSIRRFAGRFRSDKRGLSGVEFALTAPVLAILVIGVTDVGMLVYNRMDTTSSIQAGAQYFMAGGSDTDQAINAVRRSWTSMPENTQLAVNRICYCAEVVNSCSVNCADTSLPIAYNTISATLRYQGILVDTEYVVSESVRVR